MAKRDETCRNCRQIFLLRENARHPKRLPFLLKCGHTLCGVCISAAARKSKDVITCTDCGSKTPYTSSEPPEEQLVPNIHVLGLVAARHLNLKCTPRQSVWNRSLWEDKPKDGGFELTDFQPDVETGGETPTCDECTSKPAEKKCIQCDGFFCDTCFKIVHATANTLRRHRAIPAYQAAVPPPTCSVHFSRLSYYCQTDRVAVCPDCIIHSHKEHDVVTLEDAAGTFRKEFQELIAEAQSVLSAMKAKKQEVKARLQEIHKSSQAACRSMEQQTRELYTLLQKREMALHMQLDQDAELQAATFLEMELALDADMERVMEALLQARDRMKSDVRLLQSTVQLRESLQAVKEIVVKDLPSVKQISFQFSPAVRDALNVAGHFQMSASSSSITIPSERTTGVDATGEGTVVATGEQSVPSPTPPPPELLSAAPPVPDTMRSSLSPLALPFAPSSGASSVSSSARSRSVSRSRSRTATPAPPPPKTEETVSVWVSYVETPSEFYIQFKDNEDDLQAMSLQLNEALRDRREMKKSDIKEGMMVGAIFSNDDLWYRAEVTGCYVNTSPAYVSVVYVDYGNYENLPLRSITKLPPGMESGPFYGHKCLLAGIQPPSLFSNMAPPSWSQKAITHFKNAAAPEEDEEINVVMKEACRNSNGYREVDLFDISPNGSLRSVAHRLVQIGLAARLKKRSPRDILSIPPPLPLPKTGSVEVAVSSPRSPSSFYVQPTKHKKAAKNMMESLTKRRKQRVYFTYRGLVCMASSKANRLKRAVITDVSGKGEEKTITVEYVDYGTKEPVNEVWELDHTYITLHAALATHCQLHTLQPVQGSDWPLEVIERFRSDMSDCVLELKTCAEATAGEPLSVELFDQRTHQSINSMLVVEGLARCVPVVQNHVEKKRKKKMKSNNTTQSAVTPNGKILSAAPHPSLSPLISLTNMTSSLIPGHPLLKATPTSISPITPPLPPPHANSTDSPFVGQTLEMTVVQVNSPGEFYVQFPSYLTDIQPLLAQYQQFLNPRSEYSVGEMVLAPFQGERWYRGKVDKRLENGFQISYVDYGNQGVVPAGELATMPTNLGRFPPQALKAELAGVLPVNSGGVWGMDASVFFSNLILDKTVTVQAISTESMKIHVNVDGRDVGQEMLRTRMARPDPAFLPLPLSSNSDTPTSPSPNPPPSPPTVSIVSPGSEINPVSPEGPPPPITVMSNGI